MTVLLEQKAEFLREVCMKSKIINQSIFLEYLRNFSILPGFRWRDGHKHRCFTTVCDVRWPEHQGWHSHPCCFPFQFGGSFFHGANTASSEVTYPSFWSHCKPSCLIWKVSAQKKIRITAVWRATWTSWSKHHPWICNVELYFALTKAHIDYKFHLFARKSICR